MGGAALVMMEASAVTADGRISPGDMGLWHEDHVAALKPITRFIKSQGAVPAIQIAHAGRKASVEAPWLGGKALAPAQGGWEVRGPSALPFSPQSPHPKPYAAEELPDLIATFRKAAQRALAAGFEVLEIHMAHGYLLHEFLSPLSNQRTDLYGGSYANRARLPLAVTDAVREVWPEAFPLFVRISATDWAAGGWDIEQSVALARTLKERGVDLIDCSSGGLIPDAKIPAGPGFQTPFATRIRQEVGIPTGAVGLITDPMQAEHIVATGLADCVFLARELLRDPYWPQRAAKALHAQVEWPLAYDRGRV